VRVTLLSARSHSGGAAQAAVRLHRALRKSGLASTLRTPCVDGIEPGIEPIGFWPTARHARLRLALDQVPRWRAGNFGKEQFTTALGPAPSGLRAALQEADLVHLHWIGKGTLPLRRLARIKKPIVWTLHDMWPLTGGCHYDGGCGRFAEGCGCCPVLGSRRTDDLSRRLFAAKRDAYSRLDLTFVAPSHWMAENVKASPLGNGVPVHVIPNALDRRTFAPSDVAAARSSLGLPAHAVVIAFAAMGGASEPRKGFDLLAAALPAVTTATASRNLHLVVIGGSASDVVGAQMPVTGTGHLSSEEEMARALNAADVLVAPSRQDNLPNTVCEALACGVPAVAFDVGGLPDLIHHQHNGYLSRPFEPEDLARGISWVLEDRQRHAALRVAARESTARFAPELVAAQHIALYRKILDRRRAMAGA
jgi:glycosyltransferase involved in cell wall biosynthesis